MGDDVNNFLDQPEPEGTHAFIQWKGTDVCLDFSCDCGVDTHFDGFFANVLQCGSCGKQWEMPHFLVPRPWGGDSGHTPKITELDDDD